MLHCVCSLFTFGGIALLTDYCSTATQAYGHGSHRKGSQQLQCLPASRDCVACCSPTVHFCSLPTTKTPYTERPAHVRCRLDENPRLPQRRERLHVFASVWCLKVHEVETDTDTGRISQRDQTLVPASTFYCSSSDPAPSPRLPAPLFGLPASVTFGATY